MIGWRSRRAGLKPPGTRNLSVETLEQRCLLTAAVAQTVQPGVHVIESPALEILHRADVPTTVDGFSPAQVRHAYGFDKVSFGNGVLPNGKGQTIAIVDAFNDPNIANDLQVFDTQFGIPDLPSLKIVNQKGGAKLPATDTGWAGEISLDVEWAHAIAPQANILLVETNSDSVDDLMAGVDYARHAAGVSVVTMSWGGTEFFSWGDGEFESQTDFDPTFTTPAGHQGVTFVASAGDSGRFNGVQWPASSPNIISVGGTSLYTQDDAGTYSSESAWVGTSGGFSQFENEPTYQQAAQASGVRTSPDVTYDGDPNTGFAVYDSLSDQGYVGWQVIGGTSAGSPQWAALIAIADQGRAQNALATLDGPTEALPLLYSLYTATDTSGGSTYDSYFNDIQSTGTGTRRRFSPATVGFDTASGLGSPRADLVVAALMGTPSSGTGSTGGTGGSGTGGSGTGGSGSGGTSAPAPLQLPALQLFGRFTSEPPASIIAGTAGSLKLKLTNTSTIRFNRAVSITLYASIDGTLSSDDAPVSVISPQINLNHGLAKTLKLSFKYPTGLAETTYYMIAAIDATNTNSAPLDVVAGSGVQIVQPKIDLSTAFAGGAPIQVRPGHGDSASVVIKNLGNVTASGAIALNLYSSSDQTLDGADPLIANLPARSYKIKAGHSLTLKLHFVSATDQPAGSYSLIASMTSSVLPADTNPLNDLAIIATR